MEHNYVGKLPISKRLLCCAAQVPQGARVADIGADHGYLGISLLQSGRASFVHACDLREKPLHRAMENAVRYGVAEKMRFTRADGLSGIDPSEVDTVVCAGMGGDLITQIVAAAPWLKTPRYLLILQPQSSGNDLRRTLTESGFGIERETLAEDGGFLYNILCMRFGSAEHLTAGEQYLSRQLLQSGSPYLGAYAARIENALRLTVEGIAAAKDPAAHLRLEYYETALEQVREMRKAL